MKRLSVLVLCVGLCLQTCEVQAARKSKRVKGADAVDVREQTAAMAAAVEAAAVAKQTKKQGWAIAQGRRTGKQRE